MNMQDFIYLDNKTDRTVDLIDSYGKKDAKAKIKCVVDDNAVNTYYGTTVITSSTNYNSNKSFNDNKNIKEITFGLYEYGFYGGCLVVYRGEIHGIGGGSGSKRKHYKWNGTDWVSVSTLPSELGSYTYAVVYNDEIHVFNSTIGHLKWNGTSWTTGVSNLPYSTSIAGAVVYNNEIHIFGGPSPYYAKHYKWNGTSWTSVSTLPYSAYDSSKPGFTVYNNEIHILGGNSQDKTKHYKFSKTSTGYEWTSVSTLPFNFYNGSAVSSVDGLHILGGGGGGSYTATESHYDYKWNGTSWNYNAYISYSFYNTNAVNFNDSIFMIEQNERSSSSIYNVYLYMMRNFSIKIIDLVTKKGFYKFELSLK